MLLVGDIYIVSTQSGMFMSVVLTGAGNSSTEFDIKICKMFLSERRNEHGTQRLR